MQTANSIAMMKFLKLFKYFFALVVLGLVAWFVIANYSVVFSRTIVGEITAVERIEAPLALVARADSEISSKVFSFAIGIRDLKTGEIHTASSEDRQWAVAGKGQCAEAVYLPYPPWDFAKKGTYFGARLIRLYDCQK